MSKTFCELCDKEIDLEIHKEKNECGQPICNECFKELEEYKNYYYLGKNK